MRTNLILIGLFGLFVALAVASAGDDKKPDYAKLEAMIHRLVVAKAPKVHEDVSQWGKTISFSPDLKLPRLLPRKRIIVDGKEELPHGVWKRYKAWMDDPAKDIKLVVKEFTIKDDAKIRIVLDATAKIHAETDWKPWQKGLPLPGLYARADARVLLGLEIDAKMTLDFKKFPPDAIIEPKIDKAKVELLEFELLQVANRILSFDGDPVREVGRELKGFLQNFAKKYEPQVVEQMNKAIATNLKDGKASLPAAEWAELLSILKK